MRIATPFDVVRDIQRRSERQRALDVDAALRQLGPLERWHILGVFGEPGFMNNWAPYGDPYAPPAFFLDTAGFVHLRGVLVPSTVDAAMFVMPQGYRPVADYVLPAGSVAADGAPQATAIVIERTGQVSAAQITFGATLPRFLSLDGVNYRIT